MSTLYEDVGGYDGMLRLAEAWHARALADPVVAHAFSHGYRSDHTARLAAYLAEALGGPPLYTESGGTETEVARIHGGNGPHEEMDRLGIACFDQAIRDVGLDPRAHPGDRLHELWAEGIRRFGEHTGGVEDIPEGLGIPRFDGGRRVQDDGPGAAPG
ncbi:globin domain-containing protein [Brachybacterium hainanense]|uniref:Oxidoreductase n=1 Tax=Brachybacterium hainanense TaxID=1541174 RepID=A0ABV6RGM0_9MICO